MKLAALFVPFIAAEGSGEGSGSSPCDALTCDKNAKCFELHTGDAVCRCNYKFYGNGFDCDFVDKNTPGRVLQRAYYKLDRMVRDHVVNVEKPGWRRRIKKEFNYVSTIIPKLITRYEDRECPVDEERLALFASDMDETINEVRFENPCT